MERRRGSAFVPSTAGTAAHQPQEGCAALQGFATPTLVPTLHCSNPRHRANIGNRPGERKVRAINSNIEKKRKDSSKGVTGRLVLNTCSCKGFL